MVPYYSIAMAIATGIEIDLTKKSSLPLAFGSLLEGAFGLILAIENTESFLVR